jgi:hypothetical protein
LSLAEARSPAGQNAPTGGYKNSTVFPDGVDDASVPHQEPSFRPVSDDVDEVRMEGYLPVF